MIKDEKPIVGAFLEFWVSNNIGKFLLPFGLYTTDITRYLGHAFLDQMRASPLNQNQHSDPL